ncbi:MAG TPA: helix-turn-helix domain-containing protein [Alphaproteobacteria bacterium]|nr:helix-turn-helix domain-containing protein [Alphaproteobacteria bacterium]
MSDAPDEPRFMTDAEVAAFLGKSVSMVAQLRCEGKIPYLPGKPNLIERCDVVAFKLLEESPPSAAQMRAHAREWVRKQQLKHRAPRRGRSG